jgi:rare lipoprotein A
MLSLFFDVRYIVAWVVLGVMLAGCTMGPQTPSPTRATSRSYVIKGTRYHPQPHYEMHQVGMASYYGENDKTHGCPTASGEVFNAYGMTAAHKTLPLPCVVRVTNIENGRQVVLRVNDRGPFKHRRILDVSVAAAKRLGFYKQGLTKVRVQTLVGPSLRLPENRRYKGPYLVKARRTDKRLRHAPTTRTILAKKPVKRASKKVVRVPKKGKRWGQDFSFF